MLHCRSEAATSELKMEAGDIDKKEFMMTEEDDRGVVNEANQRPVLSVSANQSNDGCY